MNLKTLKGQVEYVLKEQSHTRDSDIDLTIQVWEEFYGHALSGLPGSRTVRLRQLFELPREDHVKRIRAHIQNVLKKYPPTSWQVAKKRGFLENEWQKLLGYQQDIPYNPNRPVFGSEQWIRARGKVQNVGNTRGD